MPFPPPLMVFRVMPTSFQSITMTARSTHDGLRVVYDRTQNGSAIAHSAADAITRKPPMIAKAPLACFDTRAIMSTSTKSRQSIRFPQQWIQMRVRALIPPTQAPSKAGVATLPNQCLQEFFHRPIGPGGCEGNLHRQAGSAGILPATSAAGANLSYYEAAFVQECSTRQESRLIAGRMPALPASVSRFSISCVRQGS